LTTERRTKTFVEEDGTMKRFLALGVLFCAACGGGTAPPPSAPKEYKTLPYDAAKVPKGTGWQCYVVTPSTAATLSSCFRESAACDEAQKKAATEGKEASPCAGSKQAFCVTYAEGSASETSCSKSQDDCERGRIAQGERTSRCTPEP
jgi:hypothetical protein